MKKIQVQEEVKEVKEESFFHQYVTKRFWMNRFYDALEAAWKVAATLAILVAAIYVMIDVIVNNFERPIVIIIAMAITTAVMGTLIEVLNLGHCKYRV